MNSIATPRFTIALSVSLLMCGLLHGQSTTLEYPASFEVIANPERGWYDDYYSYSGGSNLGNTFKHLKAEELIENRENDKITLILRLFYLHKFLEEDQVSQEYLDWMQADFDSIRKAGVKCIIRFAYSASQSADVWDATPDKVFSHIESLGDVLLANGDIIAGVQAGFIGAWGEWYYTKNFARPGYRPDATDQENRRMLVEKLLDVLPDHVTVQGRTPAIMRNIVGTEDPITEDEAFDGSYKSRTGHHNDCFLANASDYGTYEDLEEDLAYLNQTTKYTITGGETCDASNEYSDCVNGVPRMVELHWTYLNRDYNRDVYDKWEEQGCYEEINIAMGYRIHLVSATLTDSVDPGASMPLSFTLSNLGYAAPTQLKPIQVVLTHAVSGEQTILDYTGSNDDIRFWLPGEIVTEGNVTIPAGLAEGNYSLALRLADKDPELATHVAYSIQLANVGTWDEVNGINLLHHMVTVGEGGEGSLPDAPTDLTGTTAGDFEIDLVWTDQSDNETGFELVRAMGGAGIWEKVADLDANTESYADHSLLRGKYYQYMVRSINSYGSSTWSDSTSVPTLGVGVQEQTHLTAEIYPNPLSGGDLTITFTNSNEKQVVITDIAGSKVFEVTTSNRHVKVSRGLLYPGLFLVTMVQKERSSSEKILVL